MSQPMYSLPPGAINTGMMNTGGYQQDYVQQVVTAGQPVPGSVIPEPMHTHMKWIVQKGEEFNRSIYSNKDMNVTQMIQILYDLLSKWEDYFVEYRSYGEMLASEPEFMNLQQTCAEKTLALLETMKNIKSKGKAYSGSSRLKEMSKKLKGMITIKGNTKNIVLDVNDKARVERKKVVNYIQNDVINVKRKDPSSPNLSAPNSNPQMNFSNPSMQVPSPMQPMSPIMTNPVIMATNPMMATNNACISNTCRTPLAPGAMFCSGCGTRQVVQQQPAAPVMKFCTKCGTQGAGNFCCGCGSPM